MAEEKKEEKSTNSKSAVALKEEKVLKFWKENKIFEKSLEKPAPEGNFVFFDGPPFATGVPHYGHILAGTIKDVIPRYQTMKGKFVARRWGWDCHGLPIENLIEKELGLKNKKDIEELGIEKFNKAARDSVMRYADIWKEIVPRVGRWVDMENDYKTMDSNYTESVWWSFKELFNKNLVYEGFKSMHICPRCGTTLSNFEINLGYKDITDISVYVKFEMADEPGIFFLAWTTTPWTLPGNAGLAVNPEVDYVKIKIEKEILILAKPRLSVIKETYEIVEEFKGEKIIGKSYKPLFDYYASKADLKNKENGWKVYGASFVTTEDGTGIVHIAPAFGEDDLNLGQKENMPFIQHVGFDGKFKPEVTDFAGQDVKPKEDSQKADVEVIKYLAGKGTLYAKEKIIHSYPHCWRCETPLLNYATSSWFVKVAQIKEKLIEENKKVKWVPEAVGEGRFGKWLEGARDWAVSRSRYWGAPMPVWKCEKCEKVEVLGSINEIKQKTKSGNNYFLVRHGEAEHNVKDILSNKADNPHHITEKGKKEIEDAIKQIKDKKIDVIYSSPFVRTKESAEMISESLGIKEIIYDDRIGEVNTGDLNLMPTAEYHKMFPTVENRFDEAPKNGETLMQMKNRVTGFLYDIDKKYSGKNILVVTHEFVIWLMNAGAIGALKTQAVQMKENKKDEFIKNGEIQTLEFAPISHNENFELDLHRPYIDEIKFNCVCGQEMKRIPEIFDTWYDSGSMPFAQNHYPFENKEKFETENSSLFPADFIAEGLDQTRGWFYTLLVLSGSLFGKTPYKNVVVNGLILAEDGRKMSKSLKNYPDLMDIVNQYGADAMRYYLISSPAVRGEEVAFSPKGVDEVVKKIVMRWDNVCSFYEMYKSDAQKNSDSKNILDSWILNLLRKTIETVTNSLDKYEMDRASKPLLDFVDDLSTWYLRRSRDRFKGEDEKDKNDALATIRFVLFEFSKLMAPFMPFIAEDIYSRTKGEGDKESVHLEDWPVLQKYDENLLNSMSEVRKIVSLGLEARAKSGIKVRQPLNALAVKDLLLKDKEELLALAKDELNVKNINFNAEILNEVELDTEISPELKEEGLVREMVRFIQDLRKKDGFKTSDSAELLYETSDEGKKFMERNEKAISKPTLIKKIEHGSVEEGESFELDGQNFKIKIKKL